MNYLKKIFLDSGIRKYSANTGWLIGHKVASIIFGLLVGVWVARYLGPEKMGILSYMFSFVGLFSPVAKLGLPGIVARDLAKEDTDVNKLLSTSFSLRFLGSMILVALVLLSMLIIKGDIFYIFLGAIASLQFVFQSSEVIEYYYQANVKTKYIFISKLSGNLISSLLKVIMILLGGGVLLFAGANISLYLVSAISLFYFFSKESYVITIKHFITRKGLNLLKESWPLIFSGVFSMIYLRIDNIMIGEMLTNYEVGQYSVASKISGLWYFIPTLIRTGILPAIVNAKERSEIDYYERLNQVFSIMVILSYAIVVPIALSSNILISYLYGPEYAQAGDVLAIHIFSLIFFFLGIGRGLWVVNESYFKFDLYANVGAGVMDIVLNILLLPKFGIMGAAYATIISYSFTFFFSTLFFKPGRKIFFMQLKSILLISPFQYFVRFLRNWREYNN